MEIMNRDDLRVGDIATFADNGHEFTGPLWEDEVGDMAVGSGWVRLSGRWCSHIDFIRATRPAPALPTEPGAIILVTECRGERVDRPVAAWWDDVEGYWITPTHRFLGVSMHDARDFTEWTTAKVVPA